MNLKIDWFFQSLIVVNDLIIDTWKSHRSISLVSRRKSVFIFVNLVTKSNSIVYDVNFQKYSNFFVVILHLNRLSKINYKLWFLNFIKTIYVKNSSNRSENIQNLEIEKIANSQFNQTNDRESIRVDRRYKKTSMKSMTKITNHDRTTFVDDFYQKQKSRDCVVYFCVKSLFESRDLRKVDILCESMCCSVRQSHASDNLVWIE